MNEGTAPPQRRRSRLRLSLQGLIVAVLILGGGLGWLAYRARVQREAVAAILKAGGSVLYDWQYSGGKFDPKAQPRWPPWLTSRLGPDLFETVTGVGLPKGQLNDEVMRQVGRLRCIEFINIQGDASPDLTPAGMAEIGRLKRLRSLIAQGWTRDASGFLPHLADKGQLRRLLLHTAAPTDADMGRLSHLTAMEELGIDGRNLTNAGFRSLANMRQLKRLYMTTGSRVTDLSPLGGLIDLETISLGREPPSGELPPAELRSIRNLTKLTTLAIPGLAVDDEGVSEIAAWPKISGLILSGRGLTEVGLGRLAEHPSLRLLMLYRTSIQDLGALVPAASRIQSLAIRESPLTDESLRPLADMTALTILDVGNTSITDDGLANLTGMTRLAVLGIDGTRVTPDGLRRLKGLPNLRQIMIAPGQFTETDIRSLKQDMPRVWFRENTPAPSGP